MNEHEKALEAAKVIREYCKSMPACHDCMFCTDIAYSGWEYSCVLRSERACEEWDLTEVERKCNE